MSTATSDTASLEAERYLKEVAPHLAALPPEELADLLEDLAQHLREIAAEPGPPLAERLGSPEAYAAELLASAGVTVGLQAHPPLLTRAAALIARARRSWIGGEVARMWPFLQPAWWVLRAWLAVSLLSGGDGFGVPRLGGHPALAFLGVLVAISLSVRLAQRTLSRSGRLVVTAANVVLLVYALSLMGRIGTPDIRYVDYGASVSRAEQACLSTASGERITNLYAYDADGRMLDPVLLYDQNGRPVDNLCPEPGPRGSPNTGYRQDVNGAPVANAFPHHQTATVRPGFGAPVAPTAPVKPPAVVIPRLPPPTPVTPAG